MSTRREMMLGSLSTVPTLFLDSGSKKDCIGDRREFYVAKKDSSFRLLKFDNILAGDRLLLIDITDNKIIMIEEVIATSRPEYHSKVEDKAFTYVPAY